MACCASFPWALIEKTCFLESITSRRLEIRKTMITTNFGKWLDHLDGPASRLSITTIFFCKWPAPSRWAGLMQTGKSITTKYSFFCKWSVPSRWTDILQTGRPATTIYFENDPDHLDVQRGRNKKHYDDCLQIIWIIHMSPTFYTWESTSFHIKD